MREFINIVETLSSKIAFIKMSGYQTIDFIEDHDPELWDNKRIRYLDFSEAKKEIHIIALENDKIVGMAGLQQNPYDELQLWIKFVSVDPAYQGRGIARELLQRVYAYAKSEGKDLRSSSFTEEGERLRHIHAELQQQYPEIGYSSSN